MSITSSPSSLWDDGLVSVDIGLLFTPPRRPKCTLTPLFWFGVKKILANQPVRLTINAPAKAELKLSTVKPSTKPETSRKSQALINQTPRPKVKIINGSANSINKGFRKTLHRLKSKAASNRACRL